MYGLGIPDCSCCSGMTKRCIFFKCVNWKFVNRILIKFNTWCCFHSCTVLWSDICIRRCSKIMYILYKQECSNCQSGSNVRVHVISVIFNFLVFRGIVYSFFNLGTRWGGSLTPRPGRFTPGEKALYPLYMRLCRFKGRSGWVRKISSLPGFDPLTV
jgi:hypothetical protein